MASAMSSRPAPVAGLTAGWGVVAGGSEGLSGDGFPAVYGSVCGHHERGEQAGVAVLVTPREQADGFEGVEAGRERAGQAGRLPQAVLDACRLLQGIHGPRLRRCRGMPWPAGPPGVVHAALW